MSPYLHSNLDSNLMITGRIFLASLSSSSYKSPSATHSQNIYSSLETTGQVQLRMLGGSLRSMITVQYSADVSHNHPVLFFLCRCDSLIESEKYAGSINTLGDPSPPQSLSPLSTSLTLAC